MKKTYIVIAAAACIALAAVPANTFTPGLRTQVLSHNAYPDHGKYADRLDRTLAAGLPVTIEEDLAWMDGKSLLIHGAKNASADDPTLDSYFFPKVKPHHGKGPEGRQQGQLAADHALSRYQERSARAPRGHQSSCWTSTTRGSRRR